MKTFIKKLLREYIGQDMVSLRRYFMMSDEEKKESLPYEYYYYFDDFLIETDTDFEPPKEQRPSNYADEPYEEVNMFDDNLELMDWLEKNNKNLFDSFANYLFSKINNHELPIPDSDYPAWTYFSDVQLIKNQWLIHFTEDADSIALEGFKYGVSDMDKLGLTCHLGEFEKKYGGYNFAYTLPDYLRYARANRNTFKYGEEAVVFNASGIKLWHWGDQEPQVIFYGNTARNIIPITSGDRDKYAVRNSKTNRIHFENDDFDRVVDWIVKNYIQYRKKI